MKPTTILHGAAFILLFIVIFADVAFSQSDRSVRVPDQVEENVNELRDLTEQMNTISESFVQRIQTLTSDYKDLHEDYLNSGGISQERYTSEQLAEKLAEIYSENHRYYTEIGHVSNRVVYLAEHLNNVDLSNDEINKVVSNALEENRKIMAQVTSIMRRDFVLDMYGNLENDTRENLLTTSKDNHKLRESIEQTNNDIEILRDRHIQEMENYSNSIKGNMGSVISEALQISFYSEVQAKRIEVLSRMELQKSSVFDRFHQLSNAVNEMVEMTDAFREIREMNIEITDPQGIFQDPGIDRSRSQIPDTQVRKRNGLFHSADEQNISREKLYEEFLD